MGTRQVTRLLAGAVAVAAVVCSAAVGGTTAGAPEVPNDAETARHVLNRIAFGPRPGDVDAVLKMGVREYIEQQLYPERIPDAAMAIRLAGFRTVGLPSQRISDEFEMPLREMRRRIQQQGPPPVDANGNPKPSAEMQQSQQRANTVLVELGEQKMLRAVYSERQLQEVLADFWFNHFNVDARKGRDRFFLTEYEREAIRPNVLGKFRDLLEATAKSPAMLFYLDNWMSVDPNGLHPVRQGGVVPRPRLGRGGRFPGVRPPIRMPQQPRPNAPRGLNENYGRELLELHTLGVEGGYTQKDVTEVARAFTGWTIDRPGQGGATFRFEPRMHDEGEKVVLGHKIKKGGGMEDGEHVLDLLAKHPATARFISWKLARRFVSDAPPTALVDRMAARFRETDGDLREVVRTMLESPEFLSRASFNGKVKTPLEFVASAVRAMGVDLPDARPLVGAMQQLGMPMYQCQPPTGYKDTSDSWVSSGGLVNRMNLALMLGQRINAGPYGGDVLVTDRDRFIAAALGRDVADTTRATIAKAAMAPQVVALTLGSPDFQRH